MDINFSSMKARPIAWGLFIIALIVFVILGYKNLKDTKVSSLKAQKASPETSTAMTIGEGRPIGLATTPSPSVAEQQTKIFAQLTTMSQKLVSLTAQIETQTQANEARQRSTNEQFSGLQETLAALKNQLSSSPANLRSNQAAATLSQSSDVSLSGNNHKKQLSNKKSRLSNKATVPLPLFELISLDKWGDDTYPVVRYHDQTHTLKMGKFFMGWQFLRADAAGEGVYVLNSKGQKALLPLQKTSG